MRAPSPLHDRPIVNWKDLLNLRPIEVLQELTLSIPWLVASIVAADAGWYAAALPCSFMFFLTGLRQVHGAFHCSIGLSRRWTDRSIFVLSVLMLGSMHAVQINHLRHHRHCLDENDVEAMSAKMPAWKALLTGPLFPLRLHVTALRVATDRQRRWILAELLGTLVVVALAITGPGWLRYHVVAMLLGQCLTSFFAVWTVHHDCEDDAVFARTIRGAITSRMTYEMFYHLEHHLFPAVPTRRLPILAQRLDEAAPGLASKRVF